MKTSTTARFVTAATAAVLLAVPGAASAQDCVAEAPGTSAAGEPTECPEEETDVLGETVEREEQPAPDPEAAPALAATGVSSGELALGAAAALGAGGALVMTARRRREQA